MQENMNEEVMIKDTKKAPTKEKLLLEFEGRDSSERNANAEQRQDKGLRKQRENKEQHGSWRAVQMMTNPIEIRGCNFNSKALISVR